MKRWIIVTVIAIISIVLLSIATKLTGDLDAYHLAQPGPHGQFTGGGQGLLLSFFVMLLIATCLCCTLIFATIAGMKWRDIVFQKTQYSTLMYWVLCIPAVTYIFVFSALTLWLSLRDCMKFLW